MTILDRKGLTERINKAFDRSGLLQSEFARRAGVSEATISRWLSGETKRLNEKTRKTIARVLQVDIDWLESGKGGIEYVTQKNTSIVSEPTFDFGEFEVIRFFPNVRASAGHGIIPENEEYLPIAFRSVFIRRTLGSSPRDLIAIKAKGDSMYPEIKDEDLLIIDQSKTTVVSENPYFVVLGEQNMVKYVRHIGQNKFKLVSHNRNYDDQIVEVNEDSQFRILGEVKHIQRTLN